MTLQNHEPSARHLSSSLLHSLTQAFSRPGMGVLFAYVFGSLGTDRATPQSDVDIAVYLDPDAGRDSFDTRLLLYGELSRAMKRDRIDLVVLNTARNMVLLYDILTRGTLVYDRAPELRKNWEQQTLHMAIDFVEHRRRYMGR